MANKQIGPQDEEPVKQLICIFDIAQLQNTEPFQAHINQLKELRYDIEVIKLKFPQKSQYHKNGNGPGNGNSSKTRSVNLNPNIYKICIGLPKKKTEQKKTTQCEFFLYFKRVPFAF